ncbi:MAG: hypothetical protein DMD87_17270 [Candidatus Rokuibacteriota bacterium]|nr:MAG: hypothetical protein DMD87_17270 [Candidatus Rokubacteria bacterium]
MTDLDLIPAEDRVRKSREASRTTGVVTVSTAHGVVGLCSPFSGWAHVNFASASLFSASECRQVVIGAGAAVFRIVPALHVSGFLGAPTREECEDLDRRQAHTTGRSARPCQPVRVEFK